MHALALLLVVACGTKPVTTEPIAVEPVVAEPVAATAPPVCDPATPSSWKACEGQSITVKGSKPAMEGQTPMINGPDQSQSLVEIGGSQVIVLSAAPNTCAGPMAVTGTVGHVALGGAPGTPESYEGWSITGATIVCE